MSAPRYSLEIEGVSKYYGDKVAVRNLSANIPTGSIYGFLGPNGAGKTTTIRMIMDILHPDNGSISLFGGLTPANCKDRLGYLPEEKGLYRLRHHACEAKLLQIKRINKCFNDSNGVIFGDVVVQTSGQQTHLRSAFALNKPLHERTLCGDISLYFLRSRFYTLWAHFGHPSNLSRTTAPEVF
jgi:ABC-type branched-subunit amino acid transport system ATPase component